MPEHKYKNRTAEQGKHGVYLPASVNETIIRLSEAYRRHIARVSGMAIRYGISGFVGQAIRAAVQRRVRGEPVQAKYPDSDEPKVKRFVILEPAANAAIRQLAKMLAKEYGASSISHAVVVAVMEYEAEQKHKAAKAAT
jgi:hypothetical protein